MEALHGVDSIVLIKSKHRLVKNCGVMSSYKLPIFTELPQNQRMGLYRENTKASINASFITVFAVGLYFEETKRQHSII